MGLVGSPALSAEWPAHCGRGDHVLHAQRWALDPADPVPLRFALMSAFLMSRLPQMGAF